MNRQVVWPLVALLLTVIAGGVSGVQGDELYEHVQWARTEPMYQAGVKVGFRLDDLDKYTYVPTVGGDFYYFFDMQMALRAGVAHNSLTRLNSGVSYHSFVGDIALRANASNKSLVPFLEFGGSFVYVWGVNRGYEYVDFQPGLKVCVGVTWRVSKSVAFDLSAYQIENRLDEVDASTSTSSAPCPPGVDCSSVHQEPDGAYNPVLLELAARFGL